MPAEYAAEARSRLTAPGVSQAARFTGFVLGVKTFGAPMAGYSVFSALRWQLIKINHAMLRSLSAAFRLRPEPKGQGPA
ncbi:hypothetical protein TgHK011_008322 [Trichoderma gracile]|nr:hypothetical protein TgHK011_008322 [Trichoderma gracile]